MTPILLNNLLQITPISLDQERLSSIITPKDFAEEKKGEKQDKKGGK